MGMHLSRGKRAKAFAPRPAVVDALGCRRRSHAYARGGQAENEPGTRNPPEPGTGVYVVCLRSSAMMPSSAAMTSVRSTSLLRNCSFRLKFFVGALY